MAWGFKKTFGIIILGLVWVAFAACGSSSTAPGVGDGLTEAGSPSEAGPGDGGQRDGQGDGLGVGDGKASDGSGGDGMGQDGTSTPDVSTVDGEVFSPSCVACHGATNPAPPAALNGLTATSERGVGAHQAHLGVSNWHVQFLCADCHLVPKKVTDPGHIDTALPAELTFSARAGAATFDGTKCANVYCHGATISGGKVTQPVWTKVDGTQKACDSCHGMPPTNKHSASATNCSACHASVVDAAGKIIAPQLHINGKVEATGGHPAGWMAKTAHGAAFNKGDSCGGSSCHGGPTLTGGAGSTCQKCHPGFEKNCTFCHGGTDNQTGAPPETVDGQTSAQVPGVGRHSKHVMAGANTRYDCTICHVKPTDAFSPGHIDPRPGDVKFAGLGAGTQYNYTTYQCTNIYCHGNGNGQNGSAPWVGAWSNTCSSCHPATPTSGRHNKHVNGEGYACSECHSCMVNASNQITNATLHVDGKKDYCGPSGFNKTTKRCTMSCHGENHSNASW